MDEKINLNALASDAQKQPAEEKEKIGNWTPDFETSGVCGGKGGGGGGGA